ncbi:transglycosylase domain-containing protein [Staphylospora marina]|uniref:transglycosylase domain-containing protein n=1 Tax=Staphylospora marina TaxID=2490858 RepID=UPI000F5BFB42|nr:transglycosylase domain-containing protein [Staphylospora marina]
MDDFRRNNDRRDQLRSSYTPMPPRSRSQRVGPTSRSARSARGAGKVSVKTGWRRFFNMKWILLVLLTVLLLTVGGCSAIMLSADFYDLESIEAENMPQVSKIYDSNKQVVAQFGAALREHVKIEELRKHNNLMVDAFVKVEDRRFYEHNGIDFEGLGRAVIKNIVSFGAAQGASTITQQVCKNIVLQDDSKTMTRKIRELGCALLLEKDYSKDKILEAYLNYINFGGEIAGVQMAAKVYFDVDLTQKSLKKEEAAMLAGMPKAPTTYNPLRKKEKAIERRNVVLKLVLPVDDVMPPLISQEEAEQLAKKPLEVCEDCYKRYAVKSGYAAYKDLVAKELKEKYNIDREELERGGYHIFTGLNTKAQKAVEEALKKDELFTNNDGKPLTGADAGITLLDPKTGLIAAVGGGREFAPGFMNRATQLIQPGSTIKPLTVYTPAIKDKDYNEYSIVKDEKIKIGEWEPKNYSGDAKGDVEMQEMVKQSLNLSTIHLLQEMGLERAFRYAQELGLPMEQADKGWAPLALGGMSKGVNTVQMAQAYSVYPNFGSYIPAHTIKEVRLPNGDTKKPDDLEEKQVFDKKSTYYMTRMLKQVVEDGTGKKARLKDGRDVAGKTGTTQKGESAWFVGYTPDLVGAVMLFYEKEKGPEMTGGSAPAKIFSYVMSETLKDTPKKKFKNPGVPEPEPPFKLEPPRIIEAKYNAKENKVIVRWKRMSSRVKFRIERSEGGDFQVVGEAGPGSTQFEDTSVQPPNDGGGGFLDWLGGGGGGEKVYTYRVVAIDTEADDPENAEMASDPATVKLKPEKKEEKPGDGNDDGKDGDGRGGHDDGRPGRKDDDPGTEPPGGDGDRKNPGPGTWPFGRN